MSTDKIREQIKFHTEAVKYAKITRQISQHETVLSHGYLLSYSEELVLLQEADDFRLLGYIVIPISQIQKIRFNKWDKYYDKIMELEAEKDKIGIPYNIDLTDWKSVFTSISESGLNVIVECEGKEFDTFNIGPITKIGNKRVSILNFDPEGYFDDEPTKIAFTKISKIQFNDHYADVFSKYTRYRKPKKLIASGE